MSKYSVSYMAPVVSLVAACDRNEIVSIDQPVWGIMVRRLGIVTSVQLHVGKSGQPITLRQGNRITFRNKPTLAGIYITSPAGGAGALAEIVVVQDADDGTGVRGPAFEVLES